METKTDQTAPRRLRVLSAEAALRAMAEAVLIPPFVTAGVGESPDLLVCLAPRELPAPALARCRGAYPGVPLLLLADGVTDTVRPEPDVLLLPPVCPFGALMAAADFLCAPAGAPAQSARYEPAARRLSRGAVAVTLTEKEGALASCLLSRGAPVLREELETAYFGGCTNAQSACRVALAGLRRRLDAAFGPGTLVTVREGGTGYLLRL